MLAFCVTIEHVMSVYRIQEYGPHIVRMWTNMNLGEYRVLCEDDIVIDLEKADENYMTVMNSRWEIGLVFRKYLSKI